MYFRLLLAIFGFAACAALEAATVSAILLKNGDKVSGEVLRESDGKVVVRTEVMGEITVPRSAIDKIEVIASRPVVVAASVPAAAPTAKPATSGVPTPAAPAAAQTKPQPASAVAAAPATPVAPVSVAPIKKTWRQVWKETKCSLDVSYNDQTGRHSSKNMTFRGSADYNDGPDRYHIDGRYLYGKYDGYLHSDRRDTTFRWRHDLTKKYFFQATTTHYLDNVKLIDFNLEQNLGIGWAVLADKKNELNIVGGATGQWRRAFRADATTIAMAEFSEQYSFKVSERLTLRHDASAQYSPVNQNRYVLLNDQLITTNQEAANYRLRFNLALHGMLTSRISMTLRYEYEYDNVIEAANLKSDQRTSASIGYTF